jgi:hypothetical protein
MLAKSLAYAHVPSKVEYHFAISGFSLASTSMIMA